MSAPAAARRGAAAPALPPAGVAKVVPAARRVGGGEGPAREAGSPSRAKPARCALQGLGASPPVAAPPAKPSPAADFSALLYDTLALPVVAGAGARPDAMPAAVAEQAASMGPRLPPSALARHSFSLVCACNMNR